MVLDRQTDRQTDRFAISISRVSMLTRDKKNWVVTVAIWGEVTPMAILTKYGLWEIMVHVITDHVCDIWGLSVKRCGCDDWGKFAFSHWVDASPLQHWSHYRVTVWCVQSLAVRATQPPTSSNRKCFRCIRFRWLKWYQIAPIRTRFSELYQKLAKGNKNVAISNRSRERTQYNEGIYMHKYYTVTLKSRLSVTQGHWKQNQWIDHTRLSSSRVIWRLILLWPWNVG